ncbi:unnamed protein product [Clonostachys rosea]|uniref:Mitochondrial zinc maintenance protein 1, mitochondrial n=1 Tax=Bionectria ochroleuca TaxID=29856 RepID=A0ABY6TYH9_BIOOC|nr:unnamed protein product [Clonostachys rosea]
MREGRQVFVAARNSRHRIAALSLYRALIRTSQKIAIPQELSKRARTHPVAHLFLTVLTKAQTTGSPEHSKILAILAERASKADQSRKLRSSRANPKPRNKSNVTLLRQVAGPGEPPAYVPNPRPEGEKKPGRPPVLAADCFEIPFLRFTKPQLPVLGEIMSRRRFLWKKRIAGMEVAEKNLPQALLEDEWDSLVEDQIARETNLQPRAPARRETHQWTVFVSRLWYELSLERLWDDWVARGHAFQQIVDHEHAERSGRGKDPLVDPTGVMKSEADVLAGQETRSERFAAMPALRSWHRAREELGAAAEPAQENKNDTFISPLWAETIELQEYRLVKWMDGGGSDRTSNKIVRDYSASRDKDTTRGQRRGPA